MLFRSDGINLISDFESAHINVFSHELGHILGLNHPIELIAGDYAEGREECLDCIIKRNYDENGEIYFKADDAPGYCDDDSCWRPCGTPDICALKATQKYNELLNNALIGTNHGYVNSAISTIMDKVSEKWINSFSRSDED